MITSLWNPINSTLDFREYYCAQPLPTRLTKTQNINMDTETVQTILNTGQRLSGLNSLTVNGTPVYFTCLPQGSFLQTISESQIEQSLPAPLRKKIALAFGNAESFCRYINEQKNDNTRIFTQITDTGLGFKAVLDFHGKDPSWMSHIALWQLQPSEDWKQLIDNVCEPMSQCEFAAFLDEHSDWFTNPKGADLLELVQTLEAHSEVDISTVARPNRGTFRINDSEQTTVKGNTVNQQGTMELPSTLELSVSPFKNVSPYPLLARLSYALDDKRIQLSYRIQHLDAVVPTVAADLIKQVASLTDITPYIQ